MQMKRATITNDISLAPYTTLRCGETGTVVNDDEYGIDIRMDVHHAGLALWDNVAHIVEREHIQVTRQLIRATPSLRAWLSAACVATLAIGAWEVSEKTLTPPAVAYKVPALEYQDLRTVSPTAKSGGKLVLSVTSRRNHACFWRFSGAWENQDTHTVLAKELHDGTVLPVSADFRTHNISLNVPQDLPPGHYTYASIGQGDCNGDGKFEQVAAAPTVAFEIVE